MKHRQKLPRAVSALDKFNEVVSQLDGWAVKTVKKFPEAVLLGHKSYIEHALMVTWCEQRKCWRCSYIVEATPGKIATEGAGKVVKVWELQTPKMVDELLFYFASNCNVGGKYDSTSTGFSSLQILDDWQASPEACTRIVRAKSATEHANDWERFKRSYKGTRLYAAARKAGFSEFVPS